MIAHDAFKFYGCFGGVPYYLQLLDSSGGRKENLARLYFDPMGVLYGEPEGLIRQEFQEPAIYNSILRAVAAGANRAKQLAARVGIAQTTLPRYLKALESVGIIE